MLAKGLSVEDPAIYEHMRVQDVGIFAIAAKLYKVYILVRRTNKASVKYIGKEGFVAKRIDCKAKTADRNPVISDAKLKIKDLQPDVAGLVVDPRAVGPGAFSHTNKYDKAVSIWDNDFKRHLDTGTGAYLSDTTPYAVQMDPAKPRYGAVMMYRIGQRHENTQLFIHGDYDLFSIVPVDDPASNIFVERTTSSGVNDVRGKQLMDVQNWINGRIGVSMILHGEQDHFSDTFDDTVDVFFPDGTTVKTRAGGALRLFFQQELQGRTLHRTGTPVAPAGGLWRRG